MLASAKDFNVSLVVQAYLFAAIIITLANGFLYFRHCI